MSRVSQVEIFHIKDKRYSYPTGAHANNSDSSVSTIQYMPTCVRLEQVSEHETVKENDEITVKKYFHENMLLPTKFEQHCQAFLEMITKFKSMSEGHLRRINVSKHRIDLCQKEVRPVHSAPYQAGPTVSHRISDYQIGCT